MREPFIFKLLFKNGNFRWLVIIPMLILFAIGSIFAAELFYGDWKCAFAECRIIKEN